jgi:hypothetical protein
MVTTSVLQMPENLTFERHRLIGLQEQHAEVDGARAIISESYTATAIRYGVPAVIDTGKFRPRKGDPIFIRVDKVINNQPWKKYLKIYVPQHDHSFMSRAFFLIHPDYCDFLIRMYTPRYKNPSETVYNHLILLTQIMSVEKIHQEKYAIGPEAFAYPWLYDLMHRCYQLRKEYVITRRIVYSLAKKHGWSQVKRERELVQARTEYHEKAEVLRQTPLPSPLEPLPPGMQKIILIGQGGEHADA